ncbi:methyltransferase domain-containing protein [Streptomyces sp. PTY087I2]|uniref:methyltransferase domain-containing protein n=1 Tax=Streptomyces sp. PTY087I2 TaxID=1819298 RepID=UPI00082909EE|nr:methyltransferase domain-containing protein [Streptomyces sp. PTY087I2]OCC08635.1 Release factor glutamine methyltransferase [Streptomyces sp. PTY087I2]
MSAEPVASVVSAPRAEAHRVRSFTRSLERSRQSLTRADRPRTFVLGGREWDLLDEVFAPVFSPSTGVGLDFLGLNDPHPAETGSPEAAVTTAPVPGVSGGRGSFLEIGCGAGVIAVTAALAAHGPVVASDISPQAVENTVRNAERHGVQDRLRAVCGDLFGGLDDGERFDTVFWSSNYVLGPADYVYESVHERAYVDTGYQAHRRYLEEAPRRTTEGGAALLHFSSRGDVGLLHRIAAESGRELRTLAVCPVREGEYGNDLVEHILFQILPAARPRRA